MSAAGDQLDAGQAAGGQPAQERQPPRAVLGAGDLQAQDLPVAAGIDAGGDQGMHVHRAPALADLLGEGVQPHEHIRPGIQRPGPEAGHHLIQLGGHHRHLRLRQLRHSQALGQLLHPAGGHAQQIGGGHHGGQRPLGPAAPLQQPLRVVAALPQLGDRQLDGEPVAFSQALSGMPDNGGGGFRLGCRGWQGCRCRGCSGAGAMMARRGFCRLSRERVP